MSQQCAELQSAQLGVLLTRARALGWGVVQSHLVGLPGATDAEPSPERSGKPLSFRKTLSDLLQCSWRHAMTLHSSFVQGSTNVLAASSSPLLAHGPYSAR